MFKKIFALVLICVLVSCQKETVQLNNTDLVSSNVETYSTDLGDLPPEVRDIINNYSARHASCEANAINSNKRSSLSGALGTAAYPYTSDLRNVMVPNSALPCRPDIPYFLLGVTKPKTDDKGEDEYSATFYLVKNPNYFDNINIVDVDWSSNGDVGFSPVQRHKINNIKIGDVLSVSCEIFATNNTSMVYSQDLTFEFDITTHINTPVIQFSTGYTYACTNTGLSPIIAP